MTENSVISFLTMSSEEIQDFDGMFWDVLEPQDFTTEPGDLEGVNNSEAFSPRAEPLVATGGERITQKQVGKEEEFVADIAATGPSRSATDASKDSNARELERMYKKKLREAARLRLRRKRNEKRMSSQGWTYAGRKRIANSRPRLNGRFVKRNAPRIQAGAAKLAVAPGPGLSEGNDPIEALE